MVSAAAKVEGMSPLVQAEQLPQFVGRTVVVAGKLTSVNDAECAVECVPGSSRTIRVVRPAGAVPVASAYAQVEGVVQSDLSLQEVHMISMGDALDLNVYNEMVAITTMQEYTSMFG
ncbi:hypothetical protein FVE85_5472 [Porphyridium purpureum]|uniref:Replication protein A 14 kDa subunit B n=1 Tax=Porphyridium purpureum TaxID=35688 RepID=A0A5J4Z5I2_PORPP|nr:hypothetical protein FVE85_5472 [Porphyridium purpureum]|eukprot:POR7833..scf295_1